MATKTTKVELSQEDLFKLVNEATDTVTISARIPLSSSLEKLRNRLQKEDGVFVTAEELKGAWIAVLKRNLDDGSNHDISNVSVEEDEVGFLTIVFDLTIPTWE